MGVPTAESKCLLVERSGGLGELREDASGGNPAAHWEIRSTLEAVVARWSAGCNSRCVRSTSLWEPLTYTFPHHKN